MPKGSRKRRDARTRSKKTYDVGDIVELITGNTKAYDEGIRLRMPYGKDKKKKLPHTSVSEVDKIEKKILSKK